MVFLPGARPRAVRLNVLLLSSMLCMALLAPVQAKVFKPPIKNKISPVTKFSTFKPSSVSYMNALKTQSAATSFANYLTATRQPYLPNDKVKMAAFRANLDKVLKNNAGTKLRHAFGMSLFSQMPPTQRAKYLGLRKKGKTAAQTLAENAAFLRATSRVTLEQMEASAVKAYAWSAEISASMRTTVQQSDIPDWTVVLPAPKNQGSCGSCWAFSTISIVEGASFAQTGVIAPLSEQELVDCNLDNGGCDGGWYDSAFQYIVDNSITSGDMYPYVGARQSCPADLSDVAQLAAYNRLTASNEAGMLEALKNGPIAVAINVDDPFMEYSGGVFTSDTCIPSGDPTAVNHAVVIVGAGTDADTGLDFWLVRNSWGESWGEGGHIRMLRNAGGNGVCNIALHPYQATSGDTPPPPPPPDDTPTPGCEEQTITVASSFIISEVAKQYKTTVAKLQIDNNLDGSQPLTNGQQLVINCPTGMWSEPYGYPTGKGAERNALMAQPTEVTCPPGEYAVRVYIKPSKWYTKEQWTGSTFVGTLTMTCSDGTELSIDAQPGFDAGWADGATALMNGYPQISLKASTAVDSVETVGAQSGGDVTFKCPDGSLIIGMAGGAQPRYYQQAAGPQSYLMNLQFQCSNPFGDDKPATEKLKNLQRTRFNKVAFGLSCRARTAIVPKSGTGGDTWQSLASKNNVLVMELIRANPSVTRIANGTKVFVPPCNNGAVQGVPRGKPKSQQLDYDGPVGGIAEPSDY